ncbi:hypothetical protein SAMN04488103_101182 [Gemmobacter aquatilis]|uniref:Uncharacterized protein n=1 Tax=Gemmobacter aquatilis TaxID=933059 RepID=A0A1H7YFQ7_9RHOB|nr:hypothetical protein [Gemmobacter aquatilis]SEM44785.1 hypothetical protein SAMN04488103_101182 [Gemmobacter aquatilis]
MLEFLSLVGDAMAERVSGPMSVRLYVQPLMAAFFATRSGLKDAREGNPPYFWSLFSGKEHRRAQLRDGWKNVGTVFILAMVLDVVYQIIVQKAVFPIEVVVVAFILAILPYLFLRGIVTRIVNLFTGAA